MRVTKIKIFTVAIIISILAASGISGKNNSPRTRKKALPLKISLVSWGPTQAEVDAAKSRVMLSKNVQEKVKGVKHRLLGFEYLTGDSGDKNQPTSVPTRFRAVIYNYTEDKTIVAEGDFKGSEEITVREENFSPGISLEETQEAFGIIKKDLSFASAAAGGKLDIYEAMPPITILKGERLINIGIRNTVSGENQIVGVSFKNGRVVRYENNAPPTTKIAPEFCGITSAGQGSSGQGIAGQAQLTINTPEGNPLWEMLIIRPSSSSGAPDERSGLEIRDVKYRGKSVLKRGHVPILNVKYKDDVCGPYRDWQFSEGFFDAPSTGAQNPAPGFRVLAAGQVATTSVETGVDFGNFQGVAVYQQDAGFGPETVLVTEMNAGWYRYIMEWRFATNGTIRPRFGFASTTNTCVCAERVHHVYWRFDFDIVQPNNKVFRIERGRKFLTPLLTETAFLREPQTNRSLLIKNTNGNEAYMLTPNLTDGSVTNEFGILNDTFGRGDFWIMNFKGTANAPDELNDPNPFGSQAAELAPWVNGESIDNQDVVVWYAAHKFRVDALNAAPTDNVLFGSNVVGPDLKAVLW